MSQDGAPRSRGPFGPLERLDEVQRQALDAALRITAELGTLSGGLAEAAWLRAPADRNGAAAEDHDPIDVGRIRSDVARATETFADLLRAVLDIGFDAMDELARRPSARTAASAPPGGCARLRCTVRNEPEVTTGLRPQVPQLAAADGTVLEATVRIEPEAFDLQPHERTVVRIAVDVPADARPGRYHGLLLVSGLPDAAHPITVDVVEQDGAT